MPKVMVLGGGAFDWCPYKTDLRALPYPSHHVRAQWEVCDLEEGSPIAALAP